MAYGGLLRRLLSAQPSQSPIDLISWDRLVACMISSTCAQDWRGKAVGIVAKPYPRAAGPMAFCRNTRDGGRHRRPAQGITRQLGLSKTDLFVVRDLALDDTLASNLALQCRLKVI